MNVPVYRWLEDVVESKGSLICRISPNAVTAMGVLAGGGALLALRDRLGWLVLLSCALLREVCDILDGALARRCKTESRAGAVLDVLSDSLYVWGAATIVLTRLWPGRRPGDWVLYALALAASTVMADELAHVLRRVPSHHGESWVGRNSILAGPVLLGAAKLYLDSYGR